MNGAHDLGGVVGLGPIHPEAEEDEPVFHADWEKRAFGLTLATAFLGEWNIDISRHARERQHPVTYLTNGYYETWLAGLETLLVEHNLANREELVTGKMQFKVADAITQKRVHPEQVSAILSRGGPADRATTVKQTFNVGDKVKVKLFIAQGHTRVPQYVRGQTGVVQAYHGSHVLPDESSKGNPVGMHLYNIAFRGSAIWGKKNTSTLHLDLWQTYLEKA